MLAIECHFPSLKGPVGDRAKLHVPMLSHMRHNHPACTKESPAIASVGADTTFVRSRAAIEQKSRSSLPCLGMLHALCYADSVWHVSHVHEMNKHFSI